jgi:phosphate transport system permease protein
LESLVSDKTISNNIIADDSRIKRFRLFDLIFKKGVGLSAIIFILLISGFFLTLLIKSVASIQTFGFDFYSKSIWNPVENEFGSFPFLIGTLITSFFALAITIPFSVAVSIFLGEYFQKGFFSNLLRNTVSGACFSLSLLSGRLKPLLVFLL